MSTIPVRKACCASSSFPQKPKATSSVSVAVGTLSAKGMSDGSGLIASKAEDGGAQGAQGPGLAGLDGLEDAVLDLLCDLDSSHMEPSSFGGLGMLSGVLTISSRRATRTNIVVVPTTGPLARPHRPRCPGRCRPAPAPGPPSLSRTAPAGLSCRTCPPTCGGRRRSPRCARAAATWRSPRPTSGPGRRRP